MTRALISAAAAAAKIGMPIGEFYRTRHQLEAFAGFPPATIGRGRHQRAKYDPIAIERWMELQLPEHLRAPSAAAPADPHNEPHAAVDNSAHWQRIIEKRLEAA